MNNAENLYYRQEGKDIITYNEVVKIGDDILLSKIVKIYGLEEFKFVHVERNYIARNVVYRCEKENEESKILRISFMDDRSREDFLAETEYIRYLYENGGSVANVLNSLNGNLIEEITYNNHTFFICLFEKAKGKMFVENGYQYRAGVPITEYFYNIGKTLGKLHQLSKEYAPVHRRQSFFDKFNSEYINALIPDSFALLKSKIYEILNVLKKIECNCESFGMLHFDFNDGNYNIDFETGQITVYDFDNSCFGWYMYELAGIWSSGVGFAMFEKEAAKRKIIMDDFFKTVVEGYKAETRIDDSLLENLPLFIKANEIENIIAIFEDIRNSGEEAEYDDDLLYLIKCMENDISYKGFFHNIYSSENPFEYIEQ